MLVLVWAARVWALRSLPPDGNALGPSGGGKNFCHSWLVRSSIDIDVLQNTYRDQRAEHRSSAVTQQRQWNTRHRHQANVHADVSEDMTEKHGDDTHCQKFPKTIACLGGNLYSAENQHGIQSD